MIGNTSQRRPVNRRRNTNSKPGQKLLEVRARRYKEVAQRNRKLINIGCRFFVLLTTIILLVYGGHLALQKLFFANPDFTLREIEVRIDGTLTREQVLQICGLTEGINIFSLNLGTVREQLESVARIQSASVGRKLPDRLIIEVSERRPVAWLAPRNENADPFTSPDSLLIDARGIAVKPAGLQPEYLYLPIIYGVDTSMVASGDAVSSPNVRAALDLIRLSDEGVDHPTFHIQTIDLRKSYCMVVSDSRHSRYTFGINDLEIQLSRLEALLAHTESNGLDIDTANLMLKRNLPVTYMPVANAEAVNPAATDKASATKAKNKK